MNQRNNLGRRVVADDVENRCHIKRDGVVISEAFVCRQSFTQCWWVFGGTKTQRLIGGRPQRSFTDNVEKPLHIQNEPKSGTKRLRFIQSKPPNSTYLRVQIVNLRGRAAPLIYCHVLTLSDTTTWKNMSGENSLTIMRLLRSD